MTMIRFGNGEMVNVNLPQGGKLTPEMVDEVWGHMNASRSETPDNTSFSNPTIHSDIPMPRTPMSSMPMPRTDFQSKLQGSLQPPTIRQEAGSVISPSAVLRTPIVQDSLERPRMLMQGKFREAFTPETPILETKEQWRSRVGDEGQIVRPEESTSVRNLDRAVQMALDVSPASGIEKGIYHGTSKKIANLSDNTVVTEVDPLKFKTAEEFVGAQSKGMRFHGTGKPIEKLSDTSYSSLNYYGQGFYTTDNIGIAEGYTKKGGVSPTLYRVSGLDNANLYDMESKISPEVKSKLRGFGNYSYVLDESENLREAFDKLRQELSDDDYSADVVQEYYDSIRSNLEDMGYSGLSHVGGLKTGKFPHNVRIYWEPSGLKIEPIKTKSQLTDIWNKAHTK